MLVVSRVPLLRCDVSEASLSESFPQSSCWVSSLSEFILESFCNFSYLSFELAPPDKAVVPLVITVERSHSQHSSV